MILRVSADWLTSVGVGGGVRDWGMCRRRALIGACRGRHLIRTTRVTWGAQHTPRAPPPHHTHTQTNTRDLISGRGYTNPVILTTPRVYTVYSGYNRHVYSDHDSDIVATFPGTKYIYTIIFRSDIVANWIQWPESALYFVLLHGSRKLHHSLKMKVKQL